MSNLIRVLTLADLHQSKRLYGKLLEVVEVQRPDVLVLLGDFLDLAPSGADQLRVTACAETIAQLPVANLIAVRGNHEAMNFIEFAEALTERGRILTTLHGEVFTFGPMAAVGFPCSLGDSLGFTLFKKPLPENPTEWLPKLMKLAGPSGRFLWFSHEPITGIHAWPELLEMVERFQPMLIVHGHDHATAMKNGNWYHRVGVTTAVNVGQAHDGELHYVLIDAEFDSSRPSLPRRVTVTGFPWGQSIVLPAR